MKRLCTQLFEMTKDASFHFWCNTLHAKLNNLELLFFL